MGSLWSDLRLALRVLARAPGYTAVAVITLGLAIGASTTMFSVLSGVLIKPLPYRDPDRLVVLWEKTPTVPEFSIAHADLTDWRKQQKSFEDIAGFRYDSFILTGLDRPELLNGLMTSASLLPMLGFDPQLGRHFLAEEDRVGAARVVMITDGLWRRRFGGERSAVGHTVILNEVAHTIVGVLPASFSAFNPYVQVVVPLDVHAAPWTGRGIRPGIFALARLKHGVTFEQARADMESVGSVVREQHHKVTQWMPGLSMLKERLVRDVRPTLLVLMGAVGFVLLIAVANVANLMLARGTTRRKEMAIRAALGAGRGRLVRQLLVESATLSLLGGGIGVLLALWGVDLLAQARPQSLASEFSFDIDVRVLVFSIAVALVAGVLAGLAPALAASATDLAQSLKEGDTRTASGGGHPRLRSALVVSEVALSLMLLVGAGLSIQAFVRLTRADLGYKVDRLLIMNLKLPRERYDLMKARAFLDRLDARVAAVPGVTSSALSHGVPLMGGLLISYWVEGRPPPAAENYPYAWFYVVGPKYHAALQIPIVKGRAFDARDALGAEKVVMIDERLAARLFPNEDPIGKRLIELPGGVKIFGVIVGVVRHVTNFAPGEPEMAPAQFYLPLRQVDDLIFDHSRNRINITVRSSVPPETMTNSITEVVRGLDPDLPVFGITTMNQRVTDVLGSRRFAMTLLIVFAALALVLAAVGLYAVMSYLATQRTHEIGIRMALGARAGHVEMLVLKQALRLTVLGLGLGLAGALALTRVMSSMLYGVTATDPATYVAGALLLLSVALLASWLPARRATRVDPMIAIRCD